MLKRYFKILKKTGLTVCTLQSFVSVFVAKNVEFNILIFFNIVQYCWLHVRLPAFVTYSTLLQKITYPLLFVIVRTIM